MPRMDGTGPCGFGAGTTRGLGRGAGRGFARRGFCDLADSNEINEEALAAEVTALRRQMSAITQRLEAISVRLNGKE